MKKLTNTYKGWTFDKLSKDSIPIVSIKMFHIFEKKQFQITLAFNYPFTNFETNKNISALKLLYDTPYEIVFQDADILLNYILTNMSFNISYLSTILRYKDIRIEEYIKLQPTEQYKDLKGGNCIVIDGTAYIVQAFDERMKVISIPFDKDWE